MTNRTPASTSRRASDCTLAPRVTSIPVAEPRVLFADVEGLADGITQDQPEGLLVEPVETGIRAHRVDVPTDAIEHPEQCPPPQHPLPIHAGRKLEVGHAITVGVRIPVSDERIVGGTEICPAVIPGNESHRMRVGQADIRRHLRLPAPASLETMAPADGY